MQDSLEHRQVLYATEWNFRRVISSQGFRIQSATARPRDSWTTQLTEFKRSRVKRKPLRETARGFQTLTLPPKLCRESIRSIWKKNLLTKGLIKSITIQKLQRSNFAPAADNGRSGFCPLSSGYSRMCPSLPSRNGCNGKNLTMIWEGQKQTRLKLKGA